MAKTKLKSYLASISGKADGLVHYSIGRKTYARKYVIPRNPRSEAQQSNRSLFAEAMAVWKTLGEDDKKQYRKKVMGTSMHGHNLFISRYIKLHKHEHSAKIKTIQSVETVSELFSTEVTSEPRIGTVAAPYPLRNSALSASIQSIYRLYSVPV
jgi:hypothetical protein